MGCFSGRLLSSASDQKLFCEICSAFNCSLNEFVGEKVVSLSYSSTILAPPRSMHFLSLHDGVINTKPQRNSSGESMLSLCGPLSEKPCYSQMRHFSCVALEEKLNTDRAFDPQMPLDQSSKLTVSLASSLSHIPHIQ